MLESSDASQMYFYSLGKRDDRNHAKLNEGKI